jgi:hypothetical protein
MRRRILALLPWALLACASESPARPVQTLLEVGGAAGESGASGTGGSSSGGAGSPGSSGAAGSSGSSGTGGSSSGSSGTSSGSSGAAGSTTTPPPVSVFCGDAIRDPVTEECDAGADDTDLCSADCRRRSTTVWSTATAPLDQALHRYMGAGVHPVASGGAGLVVVTEDRASPGTVFVTVRTPLGFPRVSTVAAEAGSTEAGFHADPVAAVSGDSVVVAWTATSGGSGGDGDELGVALQRYESSGSWGPVVFANTTKAFSQRRPDVIWTGSVFVVAWEDESDANTGPDLRMRTFSPTLGGGAESILAASPEAEGRVALAAHGGSFVAAWRSAVDGAETIRVRADGGLVASVGPHLGGDAEDAPAVVSLGDDRVLVAYARTELEEGAEVGTTRLRGAVVDVASGLLLSDVSLVPTPSGFDAEGFPSLATAGGKVFLGWTARQHVVDVSGDAVLLQEVNVVDDVATLVGTIRSFPVDAAAGTDQRRLRLSAGPGSGSLDALLVAWEDDSPPVDLDAVHPDVGFTLMPVPFVDLPAGEP